MILTIIAAATTALGAGVATAVASTGAVAGASVIAGGTTTTLANVAVLKTADEARKAITD